MDNEMEERMKEAMKIISDNIKKGADISEIILNVLLKDVSSPPEAFSILATVGVCWGREHDVPTKVIADLFHMIAFLTEKIEGE